MMNSFWKLSGVLLGISLAAIAPLPNISTAQTVTTQPPQTPLELGLTRSTIESNNINSNNVESSDRIVTSNTIAQDELTNPSLWWAKEQFGGNLLNNWLAYPTQNGNSGRIDLLVNRQNWNSLDYIQQYEFIHHFGTDAMDRGYNLRVLNEQKQLLATYTCDFSTIPTQCNIELDATSKSMIRGGSQFGMMR